MRLYKNLPVYKVVIDGDWSDTEDLGMTTISLVEDPAVEVSYEMFEKEEEKKQINFSLEEEGVIFGVAIRCGMPIYRNGGVSGEPYYVVFEKDQIKKIVERYSQKQRWNNVSLQHNGTNIDGLVMNSFFIKDKEKGIDPKGFEYIEDGSLFVSYKVTDNSLWTELKHSDLTGFSIEIASYLNIIDTDADEFSKEEPDELDSFVNSIFAEEEDKKKIEEIEFVHVSSVNQAIEQNKEVLLDADGVKHKCQILEVGKANGRQYAVYYDCDADKWEMKDIKDIDSIKITNKPIQKDWERLMSQKAYDEILKQLDDKEIAVDKVATSPTELINQSIEDGLWLMVNYNDEQPNPHTGNRQLFIVAHGLTMKGNECVRVLEKFGDSRSVSEDGNSLGWRLMLTKRILSMRPLPNVEKWEYNDLFDDYNPFGDRSMSVVYNYYVPKNYK